MTRALFFFLALSTCRLAAAESGPMTTLRGETIRLADFRGQFVMLLFLSDDSKREAKELLRAHAEELVSLEKFTAICMIDPGSGAKMTSRGAVTGRIRKEIDRENARILAALPEASRPGFERKARHEVIDWDGSLTRARGAPEGRVGLLLLGPDGGVARPMVEADTASLRGVMRLVALGPDAYLNASGRGERIEKLLENIEGN